MVTSNSLLSDKDRQRLMNSSSSSSLEAEDSSASRRRRSRKHKLSRTLQRVDTARTQGNEAFKAQDYKSATAFYSQALAAYFSHLDKQADHLTRGAVSLGAVSDPIAHISQVFSSMFRSSSSSLPKLASSSSETVSSDDDEVEVLLEHVRPHILYSNRSASLYHLGRFEESLSDACSCIDIDSGWPKGYYRKGEALLALRRLDEALPALYRALERYDKSEAKSIHLIERRLQFANFELQDQSRNFRIVQMLAGRDFAISSWSPISAIIFNYAKMMRNHVYAICCERSKKCMVVDACWDIDGIVDFVQRVRGYEIVGAIVTHYHFDHVGGTPPKPYDQYRIRVDGLEKLLVKLPKIKAYVHSSDVAEVLNANSINVSRMEPTHDKYRLEIGSSVVLTFLHTPGHTPGSQCIIVNDDRLISGDT
eukprot:Partr_v1_DN26682_c2_g1_i2_m69461 putative tetratricopeptide repeat domain